MKKFARVGLAAAAVGATLMMATPLAFADSLGQVAGGLSFQYQDGTGALGATLTQSSDSQLGQLQAQDYANVAVLNGFTSSLDTTTKNTGSQTTTTSQGTTNMGGTTTITADQLAQQNVNVLQTQSQVVGLGNDDSQMNGGAMGGTQLQGQVSLAAQGGGEFWNSVVDGIAAAMGNYPTPS